MFCQFVKRTARVHTIVADNQICSTTTIVLTEYYKFGFCLYFCFLLGFFLT